MLCKDSKQHHVMFHELYSVSSLLCIARNVRFEIPYKVLYLETPSLMIFKYYAWASYGYDRRVVLITHCVSLSNQKLRLPFWCADCVILDSNTCIMRCSGTEILLSGFPRNEASMGAEFREKNRLKKFLCQNPHYTCVFPPTYMVAIWLLKYSKKWLFFPLSLQRWKRSTFVELNSVQVNHRGSGFFSIQLYVAVLPADLCLGARW